MMLPPSPHDPFRPPDWRWERARWLIEHGKYARRSKEDEFVLLAKQFRAAHRKCHTDLDMALLAEEFPGIFYALELKTNEELDSKWAVEARLLTTEPFTRIAQKAKTTAEVIQWYERLFFNVRDALDSPDYLCNVVVGRSIHHGITDRDYDLLWKIYAIAFGPEVVDALVTTINNPTASACCSDDTKGTLARKSSIAARTMPVSFQQGMIIELHTKLKELEQTGDGGPESHGMMIENVRSMLTIMGRLYYVNKPGAMAFPQLKHYDEQAVELRAHELMEIAAGVESDSHRALEHLKFPEAKDGQENQQGG